MLVCWATTTTRKPWAQAAATPWCHTIWWLQIQKFLSSWWQEGDSRGRHQQLSEGCDKGAAEAKPAFAGSAGAALQLWSLCCRSWGCGCLSGQSSELWSCWGSCCCKQIPTHPQVGCQSSSSRSWPSPSCACGAWEREPVSSVGWIPPS